MANLSASIDLPCACLAAVAKWQEGSGDATFSLRGGSFEPTLPDGMAVEFAYAIVGELVTQRKVEGFRFELRFVDESVCEGPETGQYLDAQSFRVGGLEVYIGTEDVEALHHRYHWIAVNDPGNVAVFPDSGLDLTLVAVPKRTHFSFHFLIAATREEADALGGEGDVSAWFAVDATHKIVAQLQLANIPLSASHPD